MQWNRCYFSEPTMVRPVPPHPPKTGFKGDVRHTLSTPQSFTFSKTSYSTVFLWLRSSTSTIRTYYLGPSLLIKLTIETMGTGTSIAYHAEPQISHSHNTVCRQSPWSTQHIKCVNLTTELTPQTPCNFFRKMVLSKPPLIPAIHIRHQQAHRFWISL